MSSLNSVDPPYSSLNKGGSPDPPSKFSVVGSINQSINPYHPSYFWSAKKACSFIEAYEVLLCFENIRILYTTFGLIPKCFLHIR